MIESSVRKDRFAFTLVELLVAISLVAMISAMLTTGMRGAVRQARERRAQGELLNYGQLLQSRVNAIAFGGLNLTESPKLARPSQNVTGLGTKRYETGQDITDKEIASEDKSRMRMLARRDFMRMVLPECQADLFYPPASLQYRSDLTGGNDRLMNPACAQVPPPPAWDQMRTILGLRTGEEIDAYMDWLERNNILPNRPPHLKDPATNPQVDAIQLFQEFDDFQKACSHYAEYASPNKLKPITWTRQYESAECLFLILSTYRLGSSMAIDNVPEQNIGDVDGDGVNEILDPWGTPVVFMRSPLGFQGQGFSNRSGSGVVDPDPFDFLTTDFRYLDNNVDHHPLYLTPIIVSAGQDREFGLRTPETITDPFFSSSAIELVNPPEPRWTKTIFGSGASERMVYRYPDPFFDFSISTRTLSYTTDPSGAPIFSSIGKAKQGWAMGAVLNSELAADNLSSIDSDI